MERLTIPRAFKPFFSRTIFFQVNIPWSSTNRVEWSSCVARLHPPNHIILTFLDLVLWSEIPATKSAPSLLSCRNNGAQLLAGSPHSSDSQQRSDVIIRGNRALRKSCSGPLLEPSMKITGNCRGGPWWILPIQRDFTNIHQVLLTEADNRTISIPGSWAINPGKSQCHHSTNGHEQNQSSRGSLSNLGVTCGHLSLQMA